MQNTNILRLIIDNFSDEINKSNNPEKTIADLFASISNIVSDAYSAGYDQGVLDIEDQAYNEGHDDGFNEGRDYGYSEGYRDGYDGLINTVNDKE